MPTLTLCKVTSLLVDTAHICYYHRKTSVTPAPGAPYHILDFEAGYQDPLSKSISPYTVPLDTSYHTYWIYPIFNIIFSPPAYWKCVHTLERHLGVACQELGWMVNSRNRLCMALVLGCISGSTSNSMCCRYRSMVFQPVGTFF